ncbi:branched-chain amino acid ABC transporter permease [Salinirubellus salinus]|uniref:Branched-chain amino acid ABC transporter permease n=1 Tax=Salinirubellus salinus TaxID=1364945 RepID=A0A9E7R1Y3_9EURY|nr:branched-chain amino acid ABC transporter permease [Salinirubellus salinus]UWM53363.1 branched-chain amino acid ABC transporter permease [Salinirubellus salinus]
MVAFDPQYLVNGVIVGSTIALAAVGLTMIFGILNFINFAHGEYLTVGAYTAFVANVALDLPIAVSLLIAIPVTAGFAVVVDRAVYYPLRERGLGGVGLLITSVGLSIALRNTIEIIWGSELRDYAVPSGQAMTIAGVRITVLQVVIIAVALVLMLVVHLLLTRTVLGISMRATSSNKSLALSSGIQTEGIIRWTWIIGISLTVVAGVLIGLNTAIRPSMGFRLLLVMFAAVILGGIGDPYGAMLGGLSIGIAQEVSVAFISASYKPAVAFAIMVLMLLWRPEGLRGDTA